MLNLLKAPELKVLLVTIVILIVLALSTLVGARIISLARIGPSNRPLSCLLVGYLFLSALLNIAVLAHLVILFVPLLAIAGILSFRAFPIIVQIKKRDVIEAASVVAVWALIAVWLSGPTIANALDVMGRGGVLLGHVDLFYHAAIISQIAHSIDGNSNILLAGFEAPFYHYGFYSLPAVVAQLTNTQATTLLFLFTLPFGIFVFFLSTYELASIFFPHYLAPRLLVAASAVVLFDPSRDVFLQNYLFDKSVLLNAAPGASYGAAVLVWSATTLLFQDRTSFWRFGIVLSLASFFMLSVRANYLPLLWAMMLAFGANSFLENHKIAWRQPLIVAVALLGAVLAPAIFHVLFGSAPALNDVYVFMQSFINPTSLRDTSDGSNGAFRATAVILYSLGPSLVVTMLLALLFRRGEYDSLIGRARNLVLCAIAGHIVAIAMIFTPDNNDPTEFIQRPFVAFNAVIVSLCLSLLLIRRRTITVIGVLSVTLTAQIATVCDPVVDRPMGFPLDHPWNVNSYKLEVTPSLLAVSVFLRDHNAIKAAYAFVPTNKDGFGLFPEAFVTAISASPAYLSRAGFYRRVLTGEATFRFNNRVASVDSLILCEHPGAVRQHNPVLRYLVSTHEIGCMDVVKDAGKYKIYQLPFVQKPS